MKIAAVSGGFDPIHSGHINYLQSTAEIGDRNEKNIPEMKMKGINFSFGIGGGNKINSSSWILKNWSFDSEERIWEKFLHFFKIKALRSKN